MKVSHKVSFPGAREYEQHSAIFELTSEDIQHDALKECNLLEVMFVHNTLVVYEGLLFQYVKGYLGKDDLNAQTKRLFGMLTPKLEKVVKEILAVSGSNSEEKPPEKAKKTTATTAKKTTAKKADGKTTAK